MQQEAVPELVAMAAAGLEGGDRFVAFIPVDGRFEA